MAQDLAKLTEALLDAATRAGADAADALAVDGASISIDVLGGKLEHAERADGVDIGLRVMVGQRQACVSASDVSETTISVMAERAIAMAKEAPEDPTVGLADPSQLATDLDSSALELTEGGGEPSPADLEEFAKRAEAACLAVDGVDMVQSASAGYGRQRVHLAATNGFQGGYARSSHGLYCTAISGTGANMERDHYGDGRVFASEMMTPEYIGQIAGERAVERRGAIKPKTGAYPVLFDERISSSLIGHLLGAISGGSISRGASWLRDALGEDVLPKGMSLIEDPRRARVSGSRMFDAEGLQTGKRTIIDDGVLTGWTLDLANARKLGLKSTASASRGPSAPPSPTVGNLTLTPGAKTRAELIADMGTGLLVTSLIGSSINPNTGDYSRGASGFWIENGEISHAMNECTIAGNLRDMLGGMIAANDARGHLSRVIPSLLIDGMTLAGD